MSAGQLTLYIDLEEGRKADLEVVARASLAYASAVREIAAFLDPLSDTGVDLVSTFEGSLFLNTRIKFKTASGTFEITLYTLVCALALYLGAHTGDFVTEKALSFIWEQVFGAEAAKLSDEDKTEIVERAAKAVTARAGEDQVRRIYQELDQDGAVTGLGVSREPNKVPHNVVPKSEFRRRSGAVKLNEPEAKQRSVREILDVILVSPVLENDRKRRWKFRVGKREFGAPIKDETFLDAVFSGKHPLLMRGNIHMRVALAWEEDFIDGVWVGRDFVVWGVLSVPGQYQGPQTLLPLDEHAQTHHKPKRR